MDMVIRVIGIFYYTSWYEFHPPVDAMLSSWQNYFFAGPLGKDGIDFRNRGYLTVDRPNY